MYGFIGFIVMTLLLTTVMSGVLFGANIIEIMNNWKTRRCDPYVIFTSPLYKPKSDDRSSTEFAFDNFLFCMDKISADTMAAAFAPIYEALKGFFGSITIISDLLTRFRSYFRQLMDKFTAIFESRFQQFKYIFDLFRVGMKKLESAYDRGNAMMVAMIFQGMSGYTFIQNMVNFVVLIVVIIISILAALVILLFFVMFPVIPIIITTIGIITAAGLGALVEGHRGAFCLHPHTLLLMRDGNIKPIKNINLGDILPPALKTYVFSNTVYGILEADGTKTQLYMIDGIILSGTHRVLEKGKWLLAKDIERAMPMIRTSDRLMVLNTRHHWVTCANKPNLIVSDWEEVSDYKGRHEWLKFVAKTLNTTVSSEPTSVPLIGGNVKVLVNNNKVPIHDIHIGDYVVCENGLTKVIGTYKGFLGRTNNSTQWISDGNWVFRDGSWKLMSGGAPGGSSDETLGFQLITESGTFIVEYGGQEILLRDFTECGVDNIEDCYDILDNCL